jgi:hypothetical protein
MSICVTLFENDGYKSPKTAHLFKLATPGLGTGFRRPAGCEKQLGSGDASTPL